MLSSRHLALSLTSLVALSSAFGCSSSGGGSRDNEPANTFNPGGRAGGAGGTPSESGVGGTGDPVGVAGSNNEGTGGTSLVGAGGTTAPVGGAGGAAPVTDVIAEPGPGFFKSGAWEGYAWTAIE